MVIRILSKTILILLAIILPITWLVGTNSGLKAALGVARYLTPVSFSYQTVTGRIIDRKISITNLVVQKNAHTVKIDRLDFDWNLKTVDLANIKFPEISPEVLVNSAHSKILLTTGSKEIQTTLTGKLNGLVNAVLKDKIWQLTELKLNFENSKLNITPTNINSYAWDLNLSQLGTIKASGKININPNSITISADINSPAFGTAKANILYNQQEIWHIQANGNLKLSIQHYTPSNIAMQADVAINSKKLTGVIDLNTNDLSLIMHWLPDVTRLKGLLNSKIKINGTINKPVITSETSLTQITATIPSLGVKIKPMELHLTNDIHNKFILTGKGKMRRGSGEFTIDGYVEPFKTNMPNSIRLVGKDIEFINNSNAKLTASNDLTFSYDMQDMRLDINGDINIQQGNLKFSPKTANTIKSKDIIFIDTKATKTQINKKHILFNPAINLRISEGVHFTGFGLDANVTGKVAIHQRHNNIYGDGRITIKQGTFQLPGQKLDINRGRLLYPPGTLLANPSLDLKMISDNNDLELHVNGTATAPIIRESGNLAQNQEKALSQAILTGSSLLSKNLLQDKLKLSELGVTKSPTDKDNKEIVIGRHVGKKMYLQYLHSINEANDRVRLKYDINKNWYIGIESGQKGGGVDIGFAIERD